jgi:hypothetical protein
MRVLYRGKSETLLLFFGAGTFSFYQLLIFLGLEKDRAVAFLNYSLKVP